MSDWNWLNAPTVGGKKRRLNKSGKYKKIIQGDNGTCWILSSICSIERQSQGIIDESLKGKFHVTFPRYPLLKVKLLTDTGFRGNQYIRKTGEDMWYNKIERACASLVTKNGGVDMVQDETEPYQIKQQQFSNSELINGGFPANLFYLYGYNPNTYITNHRHRKSIETMQPHTVCKTIELLTDEVMMERWLEKCPMAFCTNPKPDSGWVSSHAYAITNVEMRHGQLYITVYNPWGPNSLRPNSSIATTGGFRIPYNSSFIDNIQSIEIGTRDYYNMSKATKALLYMKKKKHQGGNIVKKLPIYDPVIPFIGVITLCISAFLYFV